jgi:hypothetical protein
MIKNISPNGPLCFVLGTGDRRRVAVTEYSRSYTMSAAPSRLPASLRSQVEQQASAACITSASFNVWLDGQQQLRKSSDDSLPAEFRRAPCGRLRRHRCPRQPRAACRWIPPCSPVWRSRFQVPVRPRSLLPGWGCR